MKRENNFYAVSKAILAAHIDMGSPAPYCTWGKHYVDKLDEETGINIGQDICPECAEKFWSDYQQACKAAPRQFTTTGWVTCERCGQQITSGLEVGWLNVEAHKFYCEGHYPPEDHLTFIDTED